MFTVKNFSEIADYFFAKAREMDEIAAKRTGLVKHNYAGQGHAYRDAAIMLRNCRFASPATKKKKLQSLNEIENAFKDTVSTDVT